MDGIRSSGRHRSSRQAESDKICQLTRAKRHGVPGSTGFPDRSLLVLHLLEDSRFFSYGAQSPLTSMRQILQIISFSVCLYRLLRSSQVTRVSS